MNKRIVFFIILFLYVFSCAISYSKSINENLSSNIFRLHIVANSDNAEDLELKYKVRDSLLDYMQELTKDLTDKNDVVSTVYNHLVDFKSIALKVINENGFDYNCSVSIQNIKFPTKNYGDIKLPCGFYDALEVKIGNGDGHNWWCIMFPPLCFVNLESGIVPQDSKDYLENSLNDEEFSLITEDSNSIKLKFKIVEIFQKIF